MPARLSRNERRGPTRLRRAAFQQIIETGETKLTKGPCQREGCNNAAANLRSRCRQASCCSTTCQREHWARHKHECKSGLPAFTNSLTGKAGATHPVGTAVEMVVGPGAAPFRAKILKFNAPGTGHAADCTAEDLATYSMRSLSDGADGEVFDEPCEDIHDANAWKRCDV